MNRSLTPAPPCVYLLADHLDAALAAGEDLQAVMFFPAPEASEPEVCASRRAAENAALSRAQKFELTLVARLLKARERAAELATLDRRFAPLATLFQASLAPLADAARELADATSIDFDTGCAARTYLRSRGLLSAEAPGAPDQRVLVVGDLFLVAGRLPLGPLLDLAANFLDTIEVHYDVFPDADATADEQASSEDASEMVDGGAEAAAADVEPSSAPT